MKKNKMLRIASVMLVLALITTCVISGTFAKYVSTGSNSDTARVAKWGVQIEGTGNLFAKNYLPAPDNTGTEATTGITVKSSTDDKLVAPGTTGAVAGFKFTGTPEVSFEVQYTGSIEFTGDWDAASCPLVFKITKTTGGTPTETTCDAANFADTIAGIKSTFNVADSATAIGTGNEITVNDSLTVTWTWASGNETPGNADTVLGNKAAIANLGLVVTINAKAVQVD